jgi:hypothetical protein
MSFGPLLGGESAFKAMAVRIADDDKDFTTLVSAPAGATWVTSEKSINETLPFCHAHL